MEAFFLFSPLSPPHLKIKKQNKKKHSKAGKTHSGKLALCSTNLSKHKRSVVLEEDLTVADGGEGGGATAEGALAGLLRGGVHGLPAAVACGQVCSSHPAVSPHVKVPLGAGGGGGVGRDWRPVVTVKVSVAEAAASDLTRLSRRWENRWGPGSRPGKCRSSTIRPCRELTYSWSQCGWGRLNTSELQRDLMWLMNVVSKETASLTVGGSRSVS